MDMREIAESVRLMRGRLETGQGSLQSAMCRLSLPMSEALLDARDSALAGESAALEEVARLRAVIDGHWKHLLDMTARLEDELP